MATLHTAPEPKSRLGYPRLLSPSCGLRVSPLCLGTMNFGEAWKESMGECDKETSFKILDFFVENGGNFVDTANFYQETESESWLGEWMAQRNNRDDMVVATKYTGFYKPDAKIRYNYQGNQKKSMTVSLESSLKRLQTSYVDIFYIHFWDFSTPIEEAMHGLHNLVTAGRVLYLGISDTPAWVVSSANRYAREKGLTPFSIYQGKWNAAERDFEREIIPMVQHEGMALAPWGAMGQGKFKAEAWDEARKEAGRDMFAAPPKYKAVFEALDRVGKRKGTGAINIALSYVMHKAPYVFPIIGGRKISHLKSNIDALNIELSPSDLEEIDDAADFEHGFPAELIFGFHGKQKIKLGMSAKDAPLVQVASHLEEPQKVKPIGSLGK
ncbi:NADP-dependent oxidoreductase domain-containing protein [Aspergillus pseudoustus]|uniref:NADP-dependent oxidoreductase domain-containing protein n=1 Tax=Aspergillus pseudoustus TaxID=1810923 RepID=A0ABR4IPV6_9EURO